MGWKAKVGGTAAVLAIAAGSVGAYKLHDWYQERDEDLENALDYNFIPPELKTFSESYVCASDPQPCSPETALSVIEGAWNIPIAYEQLAGNGDWVERLLISVEDSRYYEHDGVDKSVREIAGLLKSGVFGEARGGSTLEMQLQRNEWDLRSVSNGDTFVRKVFEARLAEQQERAYKDAIRQAHPDWTPAQVKKEAKRQLMAKYLSIVYEGRGAYGAEAFSQMTFGKSARDLEPQEAAIAVGMVQSPGSVDRAYRQAYNDAKNAAKAAGANDTDADAAGRQAGYEAELVVFRAQQERVLRSSMSAADADKLLAIDLHTFVKPRSSPPTINRANARAIGAEYFSAMAEQEAMRVLGVDSYAAFAAKGVYVYTTLNRAKQAAMWQQTQAFEVPDGSVVAGMSMERDGAIATLVGGPDYQALQFNPVTAVGRDNGSSNKPYFLATALKNGESPTTVYPVLADNVFPQANAGEDWHITTGQGCKTLGRSVPCQMNLQEALAVSSNPVFVSVAVKYGPQAALDLMKDFGSDAAGPAVPAMALGANGASLRARVLMANNMLVNLGEAVDSYSVSRIIVRTSQKLADGTVQAVEQPACEQGCTHQPAAPRRVLDAGIARMVLQAEQQVPIIGTAKGTTQLKGLAEKTGTGGNGVTGQNTDLYAIGACTDTAGIWIGNPAGDIGIPGVTSHDAARILSNYETAITPSGVCTVGA